jgi:4-diphosphocytidyl-2C-methyl-D-erythritol kinase
VRLESAPHEEEQLLQRTSTGDGMQIDESDEQSVNACNSIRESLEPDSNLTLETIRFPQKHLQPKHSISPGIIIAFPGPKLCMIAVPSKLNR